MEYADILQVMAQTGIKKVANNTASELGLMVAKESIK